MQLDPVLELSVRAAFLALFVSAVIHKLTGYQRFEGTVASYLRNSPLAKGSLARALGAIVIIGEAAVVVACIAPVSGVQRAAVIAGMLLLYALAMGVNLRRGNLLLDCGCSWGSERQPVSRALVARNLILALAAFLLMFPVGTRQLHLIDAVTVLASTAVAALAYASVNRIFALAALTSGGAEWKPHS